MAQTVADVLKLGKDVKMVDVRFIDMPGTWQHFTIPVRRLDEELFKEIDRRDAEMESGAAKTYSHQEVVEDARKVIGG